MAPWEVLPAPAAFMSTEQGCFTGRVHPTDSLALFPRNLLLNLKSDLKSFWKQHKPSLAEQLRVERASQSSRSSKSYYCALHRPHGFRTRWVTAPGEKQCDEALKAAGAELGLSWGQGLGLFNHHPIRPTPSPSHHALPGHRAEAHFSFPG